MERSITIIMYMVSIFLLVIRVRCECDPDVSYRTTTYLSDLDAQIDSNNSPTGQCKAGQYMDESNTCSPCRSGTFITKMMASGHTHRVCPKCHVPGEGEIVVENCTSTKDTVVRCSSGYYRPRWSPSRPCYAGMCELCDVCGLGINLYKDHEVVPCSEFHNAMCCEEENSDVECSPKTTPRPTRAAPPATTQSTVKSFVSWDVQRTQSTTNTYVKTFKPMGQGGRQSQCPNNGSSAFLLTVSLMLAVSVLR